MDCCTKMVEWTVVQRRLDGLFHKEGCVNCFTKNLLFHKEGCMDCVIKNINALFHKEGRMDFFTKKVGWQVCI